MASTRVMRLTAELAARCHRDVVDIGEEPGETYLRDGDFDSFTQRLVAERPPGPFWLFAYGSLIWKPEFETQQQVRATAQGWHRAFCLEIIRWRGSPEFPGLMMALEPGGHCAGMALQLSEDNLPETLRKLLVREIAIIDELRTVRWVDVESEGNTLRALTFYAGCSNLAYYAGGLAPAKVAHILARACGHWGSGAEYLQRTVAMLESAGIHDEGLWALQDLVAQEIEALSL